MKTKEKEIKKVEVETSEKNYYAYTPKGFTTCPGCGTQVPAALENCSRCGYCLYCD